MALKDMIKDAASTAMSTAQDAAQAAMEHDRQQAKAQGGGGIMQGLMGNYSELPVEAIEQQYGMYLMQGERFATGFALLRDKILFTDRRIVFIDHQGATGKKTAVESIYLSSIIGVELETGGAGFDHAELTFTYITSHYYKAYDVKTASKRLDFPGGFNVQPLYALLEGYAYANVQRINA